MLKYCLLLTMLLCALIPVQAAEDASPWYFAYNVENGSLVAYNLNGESHVLLESGVTGSNVIGTRITDREALLLLRVDEQFGLYDATPEGITRLVGEDGILQVPLASTAGAAVMVNQYAGQPVYASLFKDGTLTPLPNRMYGVRSYARFSQDGRFFRYVGPGENGNIGLWNYDTTTSENTLAFDFELVVPTLRADTYGERWLQRSMGDGGQASYRTISINGQTEDLGTFDESQSSGAFHMLGDSLVAYPATCESDCPFEVRGADGVEVFQGNSDTFRSLPVARTANGGLLLLTQGDQFYTASTDAPPVFIGSFTRDQYHIFNASFLAVSLDGRWLMTVDRLESPTQHEVHNLVTGEVVGTYNYDIVPYLKGVSFGDGLAILKLNDISYDFLLTAADGTYRIINQPAGDEIRVYFELLPGHAALYRTAEPYTGIFRHDLETDTVTPVLEGAWDYITLLQLR